MAANRAMGTGGTMAGRFADRSGLLRPSVPAAASLAVNGLLLAVLLTMGAARQERFADHSLNVLSLAALKGSDEGEESALTADAAAPPSVQPEKAVQPPVPPAPPVPSAAAAPPLPPLPSQVAQPSQPKAATASPAAPSAAPSTASSASAASSAAAAGQGATPPRRGLAEGLDADAPAGTSLAYAAKVRSWLYAHKIYPRRALMRKERGIVQVRFVIDRAGVLLNGEIVASSGKPALDEEAQAMMHRASPYPSAPAAITSTRIQFTAPIEFLPPV
ncbi:energy transducer TonB [Sphingobium sufflavum]|uniref:energy transducer TonB n=1 Tax=Sphingobium sufflavum TaxID=1129547 RepID=UPI001F2AE4FA|nr:energy transducer TonB [Sphingobium sufflavum]MCE7796656.1 energy transducer TonB [Sphingobium sufflavum]